MCYLAVLFWYEPSFFHDIYIEDNYPKSENEELTESELMSSVYNTEMFDREEV